MTFPAFLTIAKRMPFYATWRNNTWYYMFTQVSFVNSSYKIVWVDMRVVSVFVFTWKFIIRTWLAVF